MTPPNLRNGSNTQGPPLMTSIDGTYQVGVMVRLDWGVTVFKRSLVTGQITETFDLSSVPALVTNGITPIVSDALGGDTHESISIGIDDQNRTWVAGNSVAHTPVHVIRSAPNVINSWTAFAFPYPGYTVTGSPQGYGCYNDWNRLADGRLIWHCNERAADNDDEGIRDRFHILPLGADNWVPLVDNGICLLSIKGAGEPHRVYRTGCFVEQQPWQPHTDRVWITGNFRWVWDDGSTGYEFFIIYNDDVTDQDAWKRIDGTPQPMPVTYANTNGTTAIVPRDATQAYWFGSWQMAVDRDGHPHITNSPAAGGIRHYWWNGTAWQSEALTAGGRTSPFILRNGKLVFWRPQSSRVELRDTTSRVAYIGGEVPTTPDQYVPFCDPIQQTRGNLHLLIPDGDTPHVYEFGNHCPCYAS